MNSRDSRREMYCHISSIKQLREARRELDGEIVESEERLRGYCNGIRSEFAPAKVVENLLRRAELVMAYLHDIRDVYRRVRQMFS